VKLTAADTLRCRASSNPPHDLELSVDDAVFARFRDLIYREAGIALTDMKKALLVGRLAGRLRELGLPSLESYYAIVSDPAAADERKRMLDRICTNETQFFRDGRYPEAYQYCKANPSAFTNICRVAVSQLGEGKAAVEDAILAETARENSRMQTFISYLSVIGVCTPMIGLLGTVTGMIRAFAVLGSQGIGDPSSLSAAIGEVLVATASGLFIAIPAFGSYYFLRNRAAKVLHDIQDTLAGLLRKMPYEKLAGVHIGDDELYAADPEWWTGDQATAEPSQA